MQSDEPAATPPTRKTPQVTPLLIGIVAGGILLLVFAACAGGLLVYSFSGPPTPPGVRPDTNLYLVTTNSNPFWDAKGVVLEVRGHWVRMKGSNEKDPTVWINFNNVVYYRILDK